jgi:hypothetical protein
MATETVAMNYAVETYGADPVHGNFTTSADMHLWCAAALSKLVATPDASLSSMHDDIQAAIHYLLSCEIGRAEKAQAAGAGA